MANGRITSNKGGLIMGIVMGFLFIVFGGLEFYKGIHAGELELPVLLMIGIGLFVCVICIKGCINLLKKKKIKKNKELMRRVDAKVIGFEAWNVDQKTQKATSYYFNVSDGTETYSSEEFRATVMGESGNITETLKLMQIPYNQDKPEDTIKALNHRLSQIEMELQQCSGFKALLLKGAYAAAQNIKERLENGQIPYMEFRGHKLFLGD